VVEVSFPERLLDQSPSPTAQVLPPPGTTGAQQSTSSESDLAVISQGVLGSKSARAPHILERTR